MKLPGGLRLCYSLNVYPARGWEGRLAVLREKVPEIRRRVAEGLADPAAVRPFAVGLWLDAASAAELTGPGPSGASRLAEARRILDDLDFQVLTVNAFPYGAFHGRPVKTGVYAPDWTSAERLDYTRRAADILAALLPEGETGSISTLPGSYGAWITAPAQEARIAEHLLAAAAHLRGIEAATGKRIVLAVEMEPDCLWDGPADFLRFHQRHLLEHADVGPYLGVCHDTCHRELWGPEDARVPGHGLVRLLDAGIPVPKIQLSAALAAQGPEASHALRRLFTDEVYLHQTRECLPDADPVRHADLPDALVCGDPDRSWRVHFHLPLFLDDRHAAWPPGLRILRDELTAALDLVRRRPDFRPLLEIETYTYGVLPPELWSGSLEEGIAREYRWVMERWRWSG